MNYLIGIDIGTTHTKAVLTSTGAEVLQEAKANYPTVQPLPGYSEQDPILVFNAVVEVLGKMLANAPEKENILGVSFSAAMHSLMAIDKDGVPLTNLYTWADTRATKYANQLKNTDLGKTIYSQTGTAIHPMSPLCKIAWIKNELPEVFAKTYKFISVKEFVFYRLFNRYFVDFSIASATGLFNNDSFKWNDSSLEFAGIGPSQLSEPVSTAYTLVLDDPHYIQKFQLRHPLSFIIGASDGCQAILGSGAITPNEAALTIGTSAAVRKMNHQPLHDSQGRLFAYVLDDTSFVCGGASNNGGIVLKWFAENMLGKTFNSAESFNWFMETAAGASAGSNGLVFLPYIYGERSPVWDADARGVFVGINSLHNYSHFMRAILEGISFSLQLILQALEEAGTEIDTIYASGGFIESDFWLQLLSYILGKKVIVSRAADASAMGAIFLGLHSLGLIKDWSELKQLVVTSEVFYPAKDNHLAYTTNLKIFSSLYKKLEQDFVTMAAAY